MIKSACFALSMLLCALLWQVVEVARIVGASR